MRAGLTMDAAYEQIVAHWRGIGIVSREDLASALEGYRVGFSYNSGRIENRNITYHDTREVFENGRAVGYTGDVRTLFEIQNLKECHELMLDSFAERAPIDQPLVLAFHRTLTQGTYDARRWEQGERPGAYKRHDYVVGIRETGCAPKEVPDAIQALLEELSIADERNILTVAAYFHVAFEGIHPFADGNGRCGRALTNYLLVLHGHPPITVYDEDKLAYYGAIELWDAEGELEPMKRFLKAEAVKTWRRLLKA